VILVDANILVYAHLSLSPQHGRANRWLDEKLNASTRVGMPWASLLGFLRIVTNRHVVRPPEPVSGAWAQVEAWLECPVVWIPSPTERHRDVLNSFFSAGLEGGNTIPDAHLAALAIEHGLTLCSSDRGFSRFPGLRWENPLQ
jgi:hypothetical protein